MDSPNCLRMSAWAPATRATCLAPAAADAGSEMPRPAASDCMSMVHPRPAPAAPPMTASSSRTTTSCPSVGQFQNGTPSGSWRRPSTTPSVSVGTSAHVMPRSVPLPRRSSGSVSLNARPSTSEMAASVM